jgi:hypothetical protein
MFVSNKCFMRAELSRGSEERGTQGASRHLVPSGFAKRLRRTANSKSRHDEAPRAAVTIPDSSTLPSLRVSLAGNVLGHAAVRHPAKGSRPWVDPSGQSRAGPSGEPTAAPPTAPEKFRELSGPSMSSGERSVSEDLSAGISLKTSDRRRRKKSSSPPEYGRARCGPFQQCRRAVCLAAGSLT